MLFTGYISPKQHLGTKRILTHQKTANVQLGACCYGGATNKTSAMCKRQQQFQFDEQHSVVVLIFNNKTKLGSSSGWTFNEYRHSSKPCSLVASVERHQNFIKCNLFNKKLQNETINCAYCISSKRI